MSGELYAFISSILFSFSYIFVKKGVEHSSTMSAVVVSISFNAAFLWVLSLILYSPRELLAPEILYFVLAGLCAPTVGRVFSYEGIAKIGVSVSTAITSISPMISMVFAGTIIGERITLGIFAGTLLVVAGVIMLSMGKEKRQWRRAHLIFPFGAAFCFGISPLFRKMGLLALHNPILGGAVTITTGLVALELFSLLSKKGTNYRFDRRSLGPYLGCGVVTSLGTLTYFYALDRGNLVVVMPILNSSPLFALGLSYLFLRKLERITAKIIFGTLLVVLGVTFVTIF